MASSLSGTLPACVTQNVREAPGAWRSARKGPKGGAPATPTECSPPGPLPPGAMGAPWRQRQLFL